MYDFSRDEFEQNVADFLYDSDSVPENVRAIARAIAMDIYTEIVDYRREDGIDWDDHWDDYSPSDVAFDLMTVICFESESTESLPGLYWDSDRESRERFSREYGIPETVMDLIAHQYACRRPNGMCVGIEAHLLSNWRVDCTELTAWKQQELNR